MANWVTLVVLSIISPVWEEVWFRGFLLPGMAAWVGPGAMRGHTFSALLLFVDLKPTALFVGPIVNPEWEEKKNRILKCDSFYMCVVLARMGSFLHFCSFCHSPS